LQLEVDPTAVADRERDVLLLGGLEIRAFGADIVVADDQVGSYVLTYAVGFELRGLTSIDIGYRDGNVGDRCAGGIRDRAQNCGFLSQRLVREPDSQNGQDN